MGSEALTIPAEAQVMARALGRLDNPEAVLAEARKAAQALRDVVAQKPKPVVMNGEQYLEFEDWQTVGHFYGVTPCAEGKPQYVELGHVRGFEATSVALSRDGRVLSRATAFCLSDEEKWGTRTKYEWAYCLAGGGHSVEDPGSDKLVWEDNPKKPGGKRPKKERVKTGDETVPLFQLASMAQTRANAKVMRNVLSWVVVLAGYRPTPAEEIEELAERQAKSTAAKETATAKEQREPGADEGAAPSSTAACGHCGSVNVQPDGPNYLRCNDCNKGTKRG